MEAQEDIYDQALAEIRHGSKQSHWMWFIFPQFEGLGFSSTSRRYAIKSLAEAKAYLGSPGSRPPADRMCRVGPGRGGAIRFRNL